MQSQELKKSNKFQKQNQKMSLIEIEIDFEEKPVDKSKFESPKVQEQELLGSNEKYELGSKISRKQLREDRKMRQKSIIKIHKKPLVDSMSSNKRFFLM